MVHRDVPPVTSSQQFLDDLATHLRITKGFNILFDLKEHFSFTQLLVRTVGTSRGAGRDLGEGVALGLCHGVGVHDGLVVGGSPCREGGAWSGGGPHCGCPD